MHRGFECVGLTADTVMADTDSMVGVAAEAIADRAPPQATPFQTRTCLRRESFAAGYAVLIYLTKVLPELG
jgi:hypothetical protein